ncbi:putative RNA methyltransferase [Listeria sp. ILCC797]|uniref:putative RNA methyltransferase n=1 Tax=Listeria sp. ILCC797 TaxID=1918333 RepID=UPI0021015291|nr:methyltransferase domain-containing protein [Listeria sp. ILCC797]
MMKSKLEQRAERISAAVDAFRCPICASPCHFVRPLTLKCGTGHAFDVAKPGYLFLLPHGVKTKYEQGLFEARKRLIETGFFDGLTAQIVPLINRFNKAEIQMVDAGSGEGSHLAHLLAQSEKKVRAFGFDIAKEGVRQAARDYGEAIWAVADLANMPLQTGQTDVILNILSPASYQEFARILTDDGILIKVMPETNYLTELRAFFYEENTYSNERVHERFKETFTILHEERITYERKLNRVELTDLMEMTPLGWHITEEKKAALLQKTPQKITVDYKLVVGAKHNLDLK